MLRALGVVAAIFAAAAVAGTAGRASADGAPHLFVVSSEGPPARALSTTDARVVARYASFTLVEASGDDADRLWRAGADLRDDMRTVSVGRRSLDPTRRGNRLGRERGPAPGLAVVQFVGPVKDAWLARLRGTGVRVVAYVAQNGYLVHGSAAELRGVAALPGSDPAVRGVTPYDAAKKLGRGVKTAGTQRLAVQTLSGADGSSPRADVEAAGRAVRDTTAVGPLRTQYVKADAAEARRIAADPGVVAVMAAPVHELFDESQNQILAGNTTGTNPLLPSGPGYLAFVDGKVGTSTFPFSVDVTDEGIDSGGVATTHPDLQVDGGGASRLEYVDDFTSDPNGRDCGGHGTINAGIVGGFNSGTGATFEDASGFNYGLGIAPRAKLGGSKIFNCDGDFEGFSSFTTLTDNAYTKGARISSNSWGCGPDAGCFDEYTVESQEYDELVRDADPGTAGNQEMVEVFAAGNDGPGNVTVGTPGNAKNVITVGASEGVRASGKDGCGATDADADDAHDIVDFSSRGPATGRRKPDVVGPGTHIVGTRPQHGLYTGEGVCNASFPGASTLYSLSSGTSHSTPAIAGMAALFRQWYGLNFGGAAPSPALTKAALAQSGTDLVGGANGAGGTNTGVPNQTQGWGLANITRLLDGPAQRYFRDQQDVFGATGESFSRTFAVQDTSKPVRVTLAFTDAPGLSPTTPVVNDLNLVVGAGADTFKGNVFFGGLSTTGGSSDAVNNLESVYLPAGTSGNLTVDVVAANIAGDGVPGNADVTDQDFALTVANAAEVPPGPPGSIDRLTATGGVAQVALDWEHEPGATGYKVFRREPGGASYPAAPTATPATSQYTDTGRSVGTTECYKVQATNSSGDGSMSAEVCATPTATPGPDTGTNSTGAPPAAAGSLDLSGIPRTVRVDAKGRFRLSFRSSSAGTLLITRRLRRLEGAGFTPSATGRATVKLRLGRKQRRVLARRQSLKVTARASTGRLSSSRTLTLKAPKRKRGKR